MHVHEELQSVGTRKGTNIYVSSHNMGSYIKVSVILYMYTCEYMHVYKQVLSVSTRKGTDICDFAQHGIIYKSICNMKYVACEYMSMYVYKEVQGVSTRKGTDIC